MEGVAQLSSRARAWRLLMIASLMLLSSCRSDPDPLQDLCVAKLQGSDVGINGFPCKPAAEVTADDFFFSGLAKEASTNNTFGLTVAEGNVLNFPGINTHGLSMNRVDLAPAGLGVPHSHPRATELVLVTKGRVLVGFVTTGNVFFSRVLKAGEIYVVPRGLVHFVYNVGEGKAVVFTAFNSQLPGTVLPPLALFGSKPPIPNEVLAKAFQVDEKVISSIKSKFGN